MAFNFRNLFQTPSSSSSVDKPATADELFAQAIAAYQSKDLARAVDLFDRVIALRSDDAESYYKRGNALKDLGRLEAALHSYDGAIQHKPDFQYAWCNRGVVQQSLEMFEPALKSFERAIALNPNDVVTLLNHTSLLQRLSRWQEALASCDRAIALQAQSPQIWFHRGNILRQLDRLDAAVESYQTAAKLQPQFAEAHYNGAVLLERQEKFEAALAGYERALALQPQFYQAHFNRASLLKERGNLQGALEGYDRALAIQPDYAEAWCNRGVVMQELGRFDEALTHYDHVIDLARRDPAVASRPVNPEAHFGRASILMKTARREQAMTEYETAIRLKPDFADAHYNRALALLLHGDYREGLLNYEWRWRVARKLGLVELEHVTRYPLWLGTEPIAGKKLLVYSEQGLGDTLQFCRFVTNVARMGAQVTLECAKPLVGLLKSLEGVSRIVTNGELLPEADFRCPIMSLPLALKTTLDTIPAAAGYLHPEAAKIDACRVRLGEKKRPRIGLTWSGNPKQGADRERSVSLAIWIDYLPREFDYYCLQKEVRPADLQTLSANPWIVNDPALLNGFDETAALCENLDLVISVCTSIAHLSGALGRPTWVMLPFIPDWRWLLERRDSPWYQHTQLYRQSTMGDWAGVFTQVAADLRQRFA